MGRMVEVAYGYRGVELPDGHVYASGDVVALADAEFAEIPIGWIGSVLVDMGSVTDPVRPGEEATDGPASTPSLRTLGTGPLQAASGNHSHAGGGGGPSAYQQDFAVASNTWTINHDLGFTPNVTCYGGLGLTGGEIIGAILTNSTTQTVVGFAVPVSGSANCS